MRKILFFGGIVLLLTAVIVILLTLRTQQKKTSTNLSKQKEVTPFVLILKSGTVEYRRNSNDSYLILATGSASLPSKTMVKTGAGTADVLLENGSMISLDENTEVTLGADSTGIKIQQFLGNTWHRVQKLLGVQTYQVITPTAVATVRGTKFGVRTLVGISKIITTENTVGIQSRTINPEGQEEFGKEELVSEGNEGEIYEAEREVIIQEISPEEKNDKWFKKNEAYDKKYDEKVEELKKEFETMRNEEKRVEDIKKEIQKDEINLKKDQEETSKESLRKDDFKLDPPPTRPPLDEIRENPTPTRHASQGDAGRQPSPNRGGEREERLPPPPPPPPPPEGVSKESEGEVRGAEDKKPVDRLQILDEKQKMEKNPRDDKN